MVLRSPLERCPICGYSLHGLPTAHRCPECGFEYDQRTIVFKRSRRWVWTLAGLMWVGLILYMFLPSLMMEVQRLFRVTQVTALGVIAAFVATGLVVVQLVYSRRRSWAVVKPDAVIVCVGGRVATIDPREISMISADERWIKRRGIDSLISLRGVFDSVAEARVFRSMALDPSSAAAAVVVGRGASAPGAAAGLGEQKARRGLFGGRLLTRVGVAIFIGSLLTIAAATVIAPGGPFYCVAAGTAWIGIALALTGQWKSDSRRAHGP